MPENNEDWVRQEEAQNEAWAEIKWAIPDNLQTLCLSCNSAKGGRVQ